jgi:hypothetical protein
MTGTNHFQLRPIQFFLGGVPAGMELITVFIFPPWRRKDQQDVQARLAA